MLLARYFARGHTFASGALAFRSLTGRAAPTTAVPRRSFHSLRGGFLGDSKSLRFLPERAHAASAAAAATTATTRACRPASKYSTSAAPPFQPKPARAKRRSKKRKRYTQADAVAQLRRGKKIAAFFRHAHRGQSLAARKVVHSCVPSIDHNMSDRAYQAHRLRLRDTLYAHLIRQARTWREVRHALVDGHVADMQHDAARFMQAERSSLSAPFAAALERVCFPARGSDQRGAVGAGADEPADGGGADVGRSGNMGRRGDVADGSASATLASESPPSSPNTALAGAPAPFFADGHVVPTFQDRERAVQQIVRLMKAQFVIPPVRALTTLVVFERDRPGGPDLEACARYFEHAFPPPPRGGGGKAAASEKRSPSSKGNSKSADDDVDDRRKMFNALISACAQSGDIAAADSYFQRMLGWRDAHASLTDASPQHFERCRRFHPDIFTLNGLLLACARAHHEDPSTGSFVRPSDIVTAEAYFERLVHVERVRPDVHTFAILLDCCIKQPKGADIERIDRWYDVMRNNTKGLVLVDSGDRRRGGGGGGGNNKTRIIDKSNSTCRSESGSIIAGNGSDGRNAPAIDLDDDRDGNDGDKTTNGCFWYGAVTPNAFIYQTMINSAANLFRSPSTSSYSSVAVKGDVELAAHYMSLCVAEEQRTLSVGLLRNVEMYNALITCCARAFGGAMSVKAEEYFEEMLSLGLQPDLLTYNALIDCASKPQAPQLSLLEEHADILLEREEQQQQQQYPPQEVDAPSENNNHDRHEGSSEDTPHSAEFVDELELHLWWQGGSDLALAERYFRMMQADTVGASACQPDAATFGALLTACANHRCRGSKEEEALEIAAVVSRAKDFYGMLCERHRPNQAHLTQMLMVLGNAGQFEEAMAFFQNEMLDRWACRPSRVTISALVSLADKAGDVGRVDALCFGGGTGGRRSGKGDLRDYAGTVRESLRYSGSPYTPNKSNPRQHSRTRQRQSEGGGEEEDSRRQWQAPQESKTQRHFHVDLHYLNVGEAKAVLRHVLRDRVLAEYCNAMHDDTSSSRTRGPDHPVMASELRVITGIGGYRIEAFEPVLPNAMREYLAAIPGPAFTDTENNGGMFVLRARDVQAWLQEYGREGRREELRW